MLFAFRDAASKCKKLIAFAVFAEIIQSFESISFIPALDLGVIRPLRLGKVIMAVLGI